MHNKILWRRLVLTYIHRNPGVKTIEAELERALYLAGSIDAANFGYIQKVILIIVTVIDDLHSLLDWLVPGWTHGQRGACFGPSDWSEIACFQ